jgi:hypothetical protein
MRVLGSMLLLSLLPLSASAQSLTHPSSGPNVTLSQNRWRIEFRNPALEKDPIKAMNEREAAERQRKDTERMNETLAEKGMPTGASNVRVTAPDKGSGRLLVTYIYEVNVSNTGDKGIRTLIWDYVFFEPGTEQEVGRRRFVNKIRISPGKKRSVVVRTASSPTLTVDARKAGKKPEDQYSEQVVVQRVEYADGSVWQAPQR